MAKNSANSAALPSLGVDFLNGRLPFLFFLHVFLTFHFLLETGIVPFHHRYLYCRKIQRVCCFSAWPDTPCPGAAYDVIALLASSRQKPGPKYMQPAESLAASKDMTSPAARIHATLHILFLLLFLFPPCFAMSTPLPPFRRRSPGPLGAAHRHPKTPSPQSYTNSKPEFSPKRHLLCK